MNARRLSAIVMLSLVIACLAVTLVEYAHRQQDMLLEGNRLRSSAAFLTEGNSLAVIDGFERSGIRGWAFRDLDDNLMSVASHAIEDAQFPVYSGTGFRQNGGKQALLGGRVQTEMRDGREVYVFQGDDYSVVGRLGVSADGPLTGMTVLFDETLFDSDPEGAIVVDGLGAKSAYVTEFSAALTEDLGTGNSRRTNVDFVSPLLLVFGTAVLVVAWISLGLTAGQLGTREFEVRIIQGSSAWRAALGMCGVVGCAGLVSVLCVLYTWVSNTGRVFPEALGGLILIGSTLIPLVSMLVVLRMKRGRKQ